MALQNTVRITEVGKRYHQRKQELIGRLEGATKEKCSGGI